MTGCARTRRSKALVGVVCVGLTAALSACGSEDPDKGTNRVGKLSATKIEKKARQAAENADSVKLSGDIVTKGQAYRLDMRLQRNGGVGKVSAEGGSTFSLLRKGKDLYLKANVGFWADQEKGGKEPSEADIQAAGKLQGKYVKVPHGDPAYKQLSGFTDMDVMLDGLLAMDGKREKGERGRVGDLKTISVRAGQGSGGNIDVSLIGTPYPLRLERGGSAGIVELQEWNKGFTLKTPAKNQVVDYGKSISASEG